MLGAQRGFRAGFAEIIICKLIEHRRFAVAQIGNAVRADRYAAGMERFPHKGTYQCEIESPAHRVEISRDKYKKKRQYEKDYDCSDDSRADMSGRAALENSASQFRATPFCCYIISIT